MQIAPSSVKFLVLSLLAMAWLVLCWRVMRRDTDQEYAFHVALDKQDRRKARFYYRSVWVGLAAVFLSLVGVEALSGQVFETTSVRSWTLGTLYGLGLWGTMIIAMVWTQVGQRASQPNSDGTSLLPMPEEKKSRK